MTMAYSCLICSGERAKMIGAHPDFADVAIVQCLKCRTVGTRPSLSSAQLSLIYQHEYRAVRQEAPTPIYLERAQQRANAQREFILSNAPRLGNDLRILDIGCGAGALLAAFRSEASVLVGFEPDSTMAHAAEEHLEEQARIIPNIFSPEHLGQAQFDVITLSHVLEHIPDPIAFIKDLLRILHPCGILFIEVPYESTRSIREQVDYHIRGLMHLWYLQEDTLQSIVTRAGGTVSQLARFGPSANTFSFVPPEQRRALHRLSCTAMGRLRAFFSAAQGITQVEAPNEFTRQSDDGIWMRMLVTHRKPEGAAGVEPEEEN